MRRVKDWYDRVQRRRVRRRLEHAVHALRCEADRSGEPELAELLDYAQWLWSRGYAVRAAGQIQLLISQLSFESQHPNRQLKITPIGGEGGGPWSSC